MKSLLYAVGLGQLICAFVMLAVPWSPWTAVQGAATLAIACWLYARKEP